MEFKDRFRAIRAQKLKTGTAMAAYFGGNKHDWSHLETGKTDSLSFAKLYDLFHNGKIDPRYLFGFYDSPDEADLEKHPLKTSFWDLFFKANKKLGDLAYKLKDCTDDELDRLSAYIDDFCHHPGDKPEKKKAAG